MRPSMPSRRWVVLACLLAATPVLAGTTGKLSGRVTDAGDSPLPGVTVSASSPAQIGGLQLAQTSTDGRFQYPRLAPGYYSVTLTLDGFVTQELTEVQVRLDRTTELLIDLPRAQFQDEFLVIETTPVVDPSQVSASRTFTSDYLEQAAIGMDSRKGTASLSQTGGVEAGFLGFLGLRVHGSTIYEGAYLVDGVDTTDPYDRLPSFTLSVDSVDEIALHAGGFEAEYGLATGGVVSLVTKSGGNLFSGSFDLRFRDNGFETAGEHYDPDEQPAETSHLNATLGGPLVQDRAWFFLSYQDINERYTPTGAPTTVDKRRQAYLAKLTWQPASRWTLAGKYLSAPEEYNHQNASQFTRPEAEGSATWEPSGTYAELTGVLSDDLLHSLRIGVQEGEHHDGPADGDLTTIGHLNFITGERYGNHPTLRHTVRERAEVETDLAWFVDDLGGSHEFKGGLRYADTGYSDDVCRTGSGSRCAPGVEGFFYYDTLNGAGTVVPSVLRVQEAAGTADFDGSVQTAFLQDAWRPLSNLTVKLGLRWDRARQTNDVGSEIADLEMLQPRLGAAWDVRGDGRNLLRASWGRFMHASSLHLASLVGERSTPIEFWDSCSRWYSTDPEECSALAAAAGSPYRTDPEGWDPAGWVLWSVLGSSPSSTAEDLGPMYADELVVSFERELFRRTALELSYVDKETHDIIEDTCIGNYPTPFPGADCDSFLFANIPGARRSYKGWILRLESRALDRMSVIASYTYSDSRGSAETFDAGAVFDVYPYHFENRYGYLSDHSRHRVKINGFVELPWNLTLAAGVYWSSEFRWTPYANAAAVPGISRGTYFVEPRGSRQADGLFNLDLQLSKAFSVGERARLSLIGSVHNALDSERSVDVCERTSGCGSFETGDPIAWQQPRRYEAGLRVEF